MIDERRQRIKAAIESWIKNSKDDKAVRDALKRFRKAWDEAENRPCKFGVAGQEIMWLNCPHCNYAHYRFGWPANEKVDG